MVMQLWKHAPFQLFGLRKDPLDFRRHRPSNQAFVILGPISPMQTSESLHVSSENAEILSSRH